MANARDRLSHLVGLASQSAPEKRRALAIELCDLLTDWPEDYSHAMRQPFEALLGKVARNLDVASRRHIAARLASSAETPVDLLNEFFFDAPAELKALILTRNTSTEFPNELPAAPATQQELLLTSLRRNDRAGLARALSDCLAVEPATASSILDDARALAVACKGGQLSRATYSALAVLCNEGIPEAVDTSYARLGLYDDVPGAGAERLLHYWRSRGSVVPTNRHAAE